MVGQITNEITLLFQTRDMIGWNLLRDTGWHRYAAILVYQWWSTFSELTSDGILEFPCLWLQARSSRRHIYM